MLNTGRLDLAYSALKFFRHAFEYAQPDRAKCGGFWFLPPLGKRLNIVEEIASLSLVDVSFASRNSPRPLKIKLAMPPSSTGHGDQYNTK